MSNKEIFKDLIDQQLSSVEFVQDYLSLHFDGIILTYYSWPIVEMDQEYHFKKIEYKNKLCELISKRVEVVIFEEENKFEIQFPNRCKINLSLKRDNNNADVPEFLYYHDSGDNWFVLD